MSYDERMEWYREKFELTSQSGYRHEKNECTINTEEEQLQLRAIADYPIKCTAKEYYFPGGRSGDLLFIHGGYNVVFVVEVKVTTNSGKKFKRVCEQAQQFGEALSALYPKYAVYALIYTLEGHTVIGTHRTHLNTMPEGVRARFPFKI